MKMEAFKRAIKNGPMEVVTNAFENFNRNRTKGSWLSEQQKDKLIFYGGIVLGAYLTVRFLVRCCRKWEPPDIVRGDDDEDFIEDCLEWHNYYRRLHGVPALILNKKLSDNALKWARQLAEEKRMYHQPNNNYGENIFMRTSTRTIFHISAKNVVYPWYREIADYVLGYEPSNLGQIGHFTQLIWKSTTELGVGRAKSKDGHVMIVVAEYWPAGNVLGEFIENVPPPI